MGKLKLKQLAGVHSLRMSTTSHSVADAKDMCVVPSFLNGWNLTRANLALEGVGTVSGNVEVQVRRRRSSTSEDMLSTKIICASGDDVGTPGVIDGAYDDVQTDDQIFLDYDAITVGAPSGVMVVTLEFTKP